MRKPNVNSDFIKECFSLSLINLMKENEYAAISITDICKSSGFGRTSYYKYFDNNKDNLLFYLSHLKWEEYKKQNKGYTDEGKLLLNHIYNHKDFFLLLRKQNLDYIIIKILFNEFGVKPDEPEIYRYGKAFFTGAYFGIIYEWINQGCMDTPEDISKKFEDGIKLAIETKQAKKEN